MHLLGKIKVNIIRKNKLKNKKINNIKSKTSYLK